jgi:hypothetical protein
LLFQTVLTVGNGCDLTFLKISKMAETYTEWYASRFNKELKYPDLKSKAEGIEKLITERVIADLHNKNGGATFRMKSGLSNGLTSFNH